jgi:hypothetical protein
MSFIQTIETKVRAEWDHYEPEVKAAFEKLFTDAEAIEVKVRAEVIADVKAELGPIVTEARTDLEQAVEAAGPSVTAAVNAAVGKIVAAFGRFIGEAL